MSAPGHGPRAALVARAGARVEERGDHAVIRPPDTLRRRALVPGRALAHDLAAVADAERALGVLSLEFRSWMNDEVERLAALAADLRARGPGEGRAAAVQRAAHDIRGHAPTFGFPLAARVADSLARLLEDAPVERVPAALVDRHVEAVRAIVHEGARGEANGTARALAERLGALTREAVAALNAAG